VSLGAAPAHFLIKSASTARMFRSQARKDMKRTITYSAVVAFSLSLCSLGLSGCGDAADSVTATEPAQTTTDDGSMDKDDGSATSTPTE
jgi:hypothetical protein